jgi:hypothetical protein
MVKIFVAHIPFRNTGPQNLLTCSEVATMDFVRSMRRRSESAGLGCVLRYQSRVEYIITEKCVGDILADKLNTASSSRRHIDDITKLYNDLAAIPFSQYGSTFYKEDVDPLLQVKPFMF